MTYRARCDVRRLNAHASRRCPQITLLTGDSRRAHDWASQRAAFDPVLHPIPAAFLAKMDGLYQAAFRACGIHLLGGGERV